MTIAEANDILYAVLAGKEYAKEQLAEALKVLGADTEARNQANKAMDEHINKLLADAAADMSTMIFEAHGEAVEVRVTMRTHKPPYPFCRHPDKCIHGRCEHDPVCND